MPFWNRITNEKGLRVIKTVREQVAINEAAKAGFRPLMKKVIPSPEIRSKFAVMQNKTTGEISIIGDYRSIYREGFSENDFDKVIDWTYYYPHQFKSPYAAYLIPKDISVGERVFIDDLIEDFVGGTWNQGDTFRLESCEAIWNGSDLEIQYDPKANRSTIIG